MKLNHTSRAVFSPSLQAGLRASPTLRKVPPQTWHTWPGCTSCAGEESVNLLVRYVCCVHGVRQILLVREHEENRVPQPVLIQHAVELVARLCRTISVIGVNHKDQALSVLEIVSPERPDLVLPSNVPHGEIDVLVLDCLDVEADGWDGCDNFAQLELVQDCSFTRGVQAHHEDAHLLLGEEALEHARKVPHPWRRVCALACGGAQTPCCRPH